MTRTFSFGALTIVMAASANAQTLAPPASNLPPRTPALISAYCLAVSAGFLESEAKAFEQIRKCARGDTVVIPAKSAGAVARLCDFSKAVVALGDNVVCVMVLPERSSK
jgi:hypothetical protein